MIKDIKITVEVDNVVHEYRLEEANIRLERDTREIRNVGDDIPEIEVGETHLTISGRLKK